MSNTPPVASQAVGTADYTKVAPFNGEAGDKNDRYAEYWQLFMKYKNEKEQPIHFFNKQGKSRTVYQYINDSVDRMNEFHLKPDWKEDWQGNIFDPITRNKIIAILSKIVAVRMRAEVLIRYNSIFVNEDTQTRKRIYSDLLEAANIHNQEDEQLIWEVYTGLCEGTLVGYEGWMKGTREVEYVNKIDPDTGEKITTTVKHDMWDDVYGEIVPMEEFFPETIWVNANEFKRKVHRVFRGREMTYAQAKDAFGGYSQFVNVKKAGHWFNHSEFLWGIPQSVNQENVWVLQWYDEVADRYGLWINGVELRWDCLPFNHKRLPFWVSVAEPIHQQFLFGKSYPDKLMSMQDVNNALLNGILDQLFIGLNSPIFIDNEVDANEGYLEPGRMFEIPPGTKVQQPNLGNVDASTYQTLQLIRNSIEESTLSAQAQGIATGGRKTKFEVQQLQEGAMTFAELSLRLLERAMRQKYLLRMYNILQYYSLPHRAKTGKKKYKFITIEDRELTNGNKGKKMIQMVGSQQEVPNKQELRNIASREEGKLFDVMEARVEAVAITRDYLMNKELELEIDIVPNSSVKESEAQKANRTIAFYQNAFNNPMFDQREISRLFANALKQPDTVLANQDQQMPMGEEGKGMAGMPGMKGQAPAGSAPSNEDLI